MKKRLSPGRRIAKFAVFAIAMMLQTAVFAQNPMLKVFEDWHDTIATQNFFQRSVVRSVSSGGAIYYYVAGGTLNSAGNYDMIVRKMDASGNTLWTNTYDAAGGNDVAADVQVDNSGNVYITGTAFVSSTDSNDAVTIKYNSSGTQQWIASYNGNASKNDGTAKLYVDNSTGDVYATGSTYYDSTNMYDVLILKYNSSGSQQWVTHWDNVNLEETGYAINTSLGNIVVGAGTQTAVTTYKMAVLTITPSTGVITNTKITGGTGFGIDHLTDLTKDASGNIYITGGVYDGSTGYDVKTIKLNSNLVVQWGVTWDGAASLDDEATGMYLDSLNNVIVTGYTQTTSNGKDYVTLKYNNSGSLQWEETYNGGGDDSATAIAVHGTDYIYVTGYSYNGSTNDYYTIRYDGSGNQKWGIGFNDVQNGEDIATAIALDTAYNVVVAGQNQINDSTRIYTTVKYIERDVTLPQDTISAASSVFVFTENRGQLLGTDSAQHPEIKYYTLRGSPALFFSDTSLSYVFAKRDTSTGTDTLARIDMKFLNSNGGLTIRPLNLCSEKNNFYLHHITGGREQVPDFGQLISFSVWNGVDVEYSSNLKGLKYYFLCHPAGGGGTASSIDLMYSGADSVKVDAGGQLIIYTKLGNITQPKAAAWELDSSGNFSSLGWQPSYNIVGTNEVKFDSLGSYNVYHTLVIAVDWGNPVLLNNQNLNWSTYVGGTDGNTEFYDVDIDKITGNSYYTGYSKSTDFPTQSAYQSVNTGASDAIALEFDSVGVLKFSTYYGTGQFYLSSSNQYGKAGAVDALGNYFVGGQTDFVNYGIAFPVMQPPGAFVDTSEGGGLDAFFAEFAENYGTLKWATYYGGINDESVTDLVFAKNGDLYASLQATGNTPRMVESGAFNDSANLSAMLMKFSPTLQLKWATMFATYNGSVDRLAFDPYGLQLFATGRAADTTFPLVNPGGGAFMDTIFAGTQESIISRFNSSDALTWSTFLGGNGLERGYGLAVCSNNGDLVASGETGSTNFPTYYTGNAYIDSTRNGAGDMYIARFNHNCQMLWSTLYGGSQIEGLFSRIVADPSGNIYVTTFQDANDCPLFNSPGAYFDSSNVGGYYDGLILSFSAQNQIGWATYFGGSVGEYIYGLDIFKDTLLYITGSTGTPSYYTYPFPTQQLAGAYWQPNLNSAGYSDGFISRFTIVPLNYSNVNGFGELNQPEQSVLTVYPNPNAGQFQVLINSNADNKKLQIFNSIGQMIQSFKLDDGILNQTISLNLNGEADGIYLVVLESHGKLYTKKVIKQ